jgi:hypothetical protein
MRWIFSRRQYAPSWVPVDRLLPVDPEDTDGFAAVVDSVLGDRQPAPTA